MLVAPNVGYAIYCRYSDSFWRSGSIWVTGIDHAKVFRAASSTDALDLCTVKMLQLAAEGLDLFIVVVPPADYASRKKTDGPLVASDRPERS